MCLTPGLALLGSLWGTLGAGNIFVDKCLLLYNFVKKCPNNSQNEYKYTAIFGYLYSRKPVWQTDVCKT